MNPNLDSILPLLMKVQSGLTSIAIPVFLYLIRSLHVKQKEAEAYFKNNDGEDNQVPVRRARQHGREMQALGAKAEGLRWRFLATLFLLTGATIGQFAVWIFLSPPLEGLVKGCFWTLLASSALAISPVFVRWPE